MLCNECKERNASVACRNATRKTKDRGKHRDTFQGHSEDPFNGHRRIMRSQFAQTNDAADTTNNNNKEQRTKQS